MPVPVQLTILADGSARPPLLIFRDRGLRINTAEEKQCDWSVKDTFQPKEWCDEMIRKKWVEEDWNNIFHNPPTPGSTSKILYADVHSAQQTPNVKQPWLMSQEVQRAEFNYLMWVLTSHSRIMYVISRTTCKCKSRVVRAWKTYSRGKTCLDYKMRKQGVGACKETKITC